MVICSACPTPQPAGAAWYRWVTPSVPSECSTQSRAATVTDRDDVAASVPLRARTVSLSMLRKCVPHRPVALQGNKPAKSLAPHTPEGFGAAHIRACTRAAVSGCRRTVQRGLPRRTTAHKRNFAVCGVVVQWTTVSRVRRLTQKQTTNTGEAACITET